jgi:hypothetical protein
MIKLEQATFAGLRSMHTLFISLGSMKNVETFKSLCSLKTLMLDTINCAHLDSTILNHLNNVEWLEWQVNLLPKEWNFKIDEFQSTMKLVKIFKAFDSQDKATHNLNGLFKKI